MADEAEVERLKRRIEREKKARKQAEQIAEQKTLEIFQANQELHRIMTRLEELVERRTQEFQEAHNKAMGVIENVADGLIITDEKGVIETVNPAAEVIFGYAAEDLLGKNASLLMPEPFAAGLEDSLDGQHSRSLFLGAREVSGLKADGQTVPIDLAISEMFVGSRRLLIGMARDISERRRVEEIEHARETAEAANQAKSTFLANMSHELRTPLNAIIGYSEMLQEEAEDTDQEQFIPDLKKIHGAGKHLLGLINDILDLSKIEAGKMELYLEHVDIVSMIEDVKSTIYPLIEKKGNRLIVDCPLVDKLMYTDLTKIRQVLFNLLSNATKFTEQGAITLKVETHIVNGEERIAFSVSDTGIGMNEDQLGRLFNAFTQADASTTRKYGGTGLGLAISRRFCQIMGGDITVTSAPNQGSTFSVDLPMTVAKADSEADIIEAEIVMPPVDADAHVVLVIDDDPIVRDLMRRFLTKEGFRVETAASGEEGLSLAKSLKPLAITLDVMMPGMDGWLVLSALKQDEALRNVPVIMLTIVDKKNIGYALGASDYLNKPIDRTHLLSILKKHCNDDNRLALLVDDDATVRDVMRKIVEKEGWSVIEAENGRIALNLMQEHTPGVILLDLMMPEMDGFEFVEEFRAHHEWKNIPIVVVTAKDVTVEDRLRLNGCVEKVLQKGSHENQNVLLEQIVHLISNYARL